MNLQELLVLDVETIKDYSPAQADQLANDVIACLAEGVEGRHQPKLKSILVKAKQRAVGPSPEGTADEVRPVILEQIKEAEARGDKPTVRYLENAMIARDVAELNDSSALIDTAKKWMENDTKEREAARKAQEDELIRIRTHQIWYDNGWQITEEEARKQAELEVRGRPAYEDDVNPKPAEKPDRNKILEEAKRSGS